MSRLLYVISIYAFIFSSAIMAHDYAIAAQKNDFPVIVLRGDDYQMGVQYGHTMKYPLRNTLFILKNFYIAQHHLTDQALIQQAKKLYIRFPLANQQMIQGVARGANIPLNDAIILNGMETLGELLPHEKGSCAFISIAPQHTLDHTVLIGRNYDYPAPFDHIARYLSVVILKQKHKITTAFIALPGEMYCPTCFNARGLFAEFNNGTPSGGRTVSLHRESLLIHLLTIMQQSNTLSQMTKKLNAAQSDFSLIVNTANQHTVKSYEFSSTRGVKDDFPAKNSNFVSTNFYLSHVWKNIPVPTDQTTWQGVTRRNHLLKLINHANHQKMTLTDFKKIMNTSLKRGGAKWHYTIYQIIVEPKKFILYLRTVGQSRWTKIALKKWMT